MEEFFEHSEKLNDPQEMDKFSKLMGVGSWFTK
jgi:hypothetical protein